VWLGRAPEAGRERTITSGEIERELRRRGLDYTVKGEKVVVTAGEPAARGSELLRQTLAFEIKCHLLATRRVLRANEVSVRVTFVEPESVPEGSAVVHLDPRDESDLRRAEYGVTFEDPSKKKILVTAIARVLPVREVAFAARDILQTRTITREDFEIRRIELDQEDRYVTDLAALVGAKAQVRIAKGAAITALDVKLKPTVHRRDVVRAKSKYVEADARALEEGAIGDVIQFEYVKTGVRFHGKILAADRVEVVEGGKR
jgi:flagella basal body P-ring formation protein FlgA